MDAAKAQDLIMKARAHWFDDAGGGAGDGRGRLTRAASTAARQVDVTTRAVREKRHGANDH